jgi:trk system potassium uptake protein
VAVETPAFAATSFTVMVLSMVIAYHRGTGFDIFPFSHYSTAMKIIIVGAGIVGVQLAKRLIEENNDVVLIEKGSDVVRTATNSVDCMIINDNGNRPEILKQAGIDKSDYLISVTGSDELNMIICNMVIHLAPRPVAIARVRNDDYSSQGISERIHYINPDRETSDGITRTIEQGVMSDITLFEGSEYQMMGLQIEESSPLRGQKVRQLRQNLGFDFLIGVIIRNGEYIIPSGETVLAEEDVVYVVARYDGLERLYTLSGKSRSPLKAIAIVGGGKVGSSIAEYLLQRKQERRSVFGLFLKLFSRGVGKSISIVEKNYEKCKSLSARFPEALVLNADISDEGFSEENDFFNYDLIIATTEDEELNLITAMYAKTQGTKKAVVLVTQRNYVHIAYKLGIDVAISIKNTVVASILKMVRRGGVRNTYSISGGKLEMVELTIEAGSPVAGSSLGQIKLPRDSLVLFISRGEEDIVPDGSYIFHEGDTCFIITRKEVIKKLEKLFGKAQ